MFFYNYRGMPELPASVLCQPDLIKRHIEYKKCNSFLFACNFADIIYTLSIIVLRVYFLNISKKSFLGKIFSLAKLKFKVSQIAVIYITKPVSFEFLFLVAPKNSTCKDKSKKNVRKI